MANNQFLFANNAQSTLAGAISSGAISIQLATGTGALFPNPSAGQQFTLTLNDAATGLVYEVCYCTARSGDVLTVVRGQEGTTARAWLVGDFAANMQTAGAAGQFAQNNAGVAHVAPSFQLVGSSSGTISLLPQAAAGTYNWNYPTTAGASGVPLLSGGGGSSPMTWGTVTGTGNFVLSNGPSFSGTVVFSNAITVGAGYATATVGIGETIGSSGFLFGIANSNATPTTSTSLIALNYSGATPNNTVPYIFGTDSSSTTRFLIYTNGGLANFSANNVNLSDANRKDAFAPYDDKTVAALWAAHRDMPWGRYKFKDQTHDDWNHGYLAQDVRKVFGAIAPELVDHFNGVDGDLGVYHDDLHNLGHVVISEIQKRVDSLQAEVSVLRGSL